MQLFFVRLFQAEKLSNSTQPLAITFEQAVENLAALPQLLIEADGSFVFSGLKATERWQIDGLLMDAGETLFYVELKGNAPRDSLQQLFDSLTVGEEQLAIACVQSGELADAESFLRTVSSE